MKKLWPQDLYAVGLMGWPHGLFEDGRIKGSLISSQLYHNLQHEIPRNVQGLLWIT